MWRSRIFFNRGILPSVLLAGLAIPSAPSARVFLTQQDALARAFPGDPDVSRRTGFLTDEQARRIREISGEEVHTRVVTYYVGRREEGEMATAYFDTHRVRTLPETLLIVIGPEGHVLDLQVLSFLEPADYLPRSKWFEQFLGRSLGPGLSLKGKIHSITGATLSARAGTRAVRRILAIHQVLNPLESHNRGTSEGPEGGSR
ncbi:MAG: FMN-binding protein [Acidobacteriota bacterium]